MVLKLKNYCTKDLHHSHTVFEAQSGQGQVTSHRDMATEPTFMIEAVKAVRGPKGVVTVGVELPVAREPLRRSRRAELPHRAPTLDKNAQPLLWIRMQNLRVRQVTTNQTVKPLPRQTGLLASSQKRSVPVPDDPLAERTQSRSVPRHCEVSRSEERRVGKECRSRWSPYH